MYLSTKDKEEIRKILPEQCKTYLENTGWKKIGEYTRYTTVCTTVWEKKYGILMHGLQIPIDGTLEGYERRMIHFVLGLQEYEDMRLHELIELLQSIKEVK